jgi:hypothetical protein
LGTHSTIINSDFSGNSRSKNYNESVLGLAFLLPHFATVILFETIITASRLRLEIMEEVMMIRPTRIFNYDSAPFDAGII